MLSEDCHGNKETQQLIKKYNCQTHFICTFHYNEQH